uniref:Uncharacterized protein n=1 Tax=Arundo donax TaxID=35708 RepID=A0A0A8YM08_ARUDO
MVIYVANFKSVTTILNAFFSLMSVLHQLYVIISWKILGVCHQNGNYLINPLNPYKTKSVYDIVFESF